MSTQEGKTPYQGKRRTFGYFRCQTCNRTWASANSWANCGQKCFNCKVYVYPFRQLKLKRRRVNVSDSRKRHPQELCEKCNIIGRRCVGKDIAE